MGLSAALLSQQWLISSATQPNMGLSAQPYILTWVYQHSLAALHGFNSTAYQPNMGLSAQPSSLTWG